MALIGVGYIGGSAALAARRAGVVGRVVGFDPQPSALQVARDRGVIDEASASPEAAVRDASIVLLAAPVRSLGQSAARIAGAVRRDATVIDVGSVKQSVMSEAQAAFPDGQFVGCHPLAGAEHVGVGAADAGIYPGRVCFVCPSPLSRPEATAAARAFWVGIGCDVVEIAPAQHDRLMAAVSHLPHVAAFALAAALSDSLSFLEGHAQTATTSLRDTSRVAASSPRVWRDIFLANREHLVPLMRQLAERVEQLTAAVESSDATALESVLALGQSCRQRLVK
jgi:prephenate dehydrogenase